MTLTRQELQFIKTHEQVISGILQKRISDLKDQLLEVPDEKRDTVINFIKEYKLGLGLLREINADRPSENFTGI